MIEIAYITVGGATQSGATIIVNHFFFVVSHRQIQSSYSDKDIFAEFVKIVFGRMGRHCRDADMCGNINFA